VEVDSICSTHVVSMNGSRHIGRTAGLGVFFLISCTGKRVLEDMSFLCMSHVIKKKICGTQRVRPVLAAREKRPDLVDTTHVTSLNETHDSF